MYDQGSERWDRDQPFFFFFFFFFLRGSGCTILWDQRPKSAPFWESRTGHLGRRNWIGDEKTSLVTILIYSSPFVTLLEVGHL